MARHRTAHQPNDSPHPDAVEVPVVGVGASAGGLEAFQSLLAALPDDTGMGFVLVQHLAPTHESALTEILSRHTTMPVIEVESTIRIEPNRVHVIPPAHDLVITDGSLELRPRQAGGVHRPVDTFFSSLAAVKGHAAIGVILSGTATDGTAGLEAIKAEGGITFAQDGTAQHDGMPRSAIASGTVDFVLPPEGIAAELSRIATYHRTHPQSTSAARESAELTEVVRVLRRRTGVDFTQYKTNTVHRRVRRRMALMGASEATEYARALKDTPSEADALFRDILIGVTSFFRNPDAFDALKHDIFPRIVADRSDTGAIRMWSVGCSTGQEAYSLAIAFSEFAESSGAQIPFQIFATDLNPVAIETARAGVYPEAALADLDAKRRRRFFSESSGGYRISKTIRDCCVFSHHNIVVDPPFSHLDLVSCRNLLIYLTAPLQARVIETFHYSLNPGGILWLGASESAASHRDLFESVDAVHRFSARKSGPGSILRRSAPASRREGDRPTVVRRGMGTDRDGGELPKVADRMLVARFAPPAVVVSPDLEIIQFRGDTDPYLAPAPGRATFGLLAMLRRGLVGGVRAALRRASKYHEPARESGLTVSRGGQSRTVTVEVIPMLAVGPGPTGFVVLFEDEAVPRVELPAPTSADSTSGTVPSDSEALRLTRELESTRDYLQSVIEQQEATNEELQAANEEAQSSNEELQSINEELETTKEEIQSSNEELVTLNDELGNRATELSRLHNDLTNLLSSVQIAIVMVDPDFRVRSFTPSAEKLLNLIPADIGRPFSDISLRFEGLESIETLLAGVLDDVRGRDIDIQRGTERWYSLRLRPYRTLDNRIDGVVVMFVDIHALKQAMEYALSIVSTVHSPLLVLDERLRVVTASRSFLDTFEVTRVGTESVPLNELGNGQWNIPALPDLLANVIETDVPLERFEVTHDFPHLGIRTMLFDARRLVQVDGMLPLLLVSIEDVTEERRSEGAIRLSESRYRELFDSSPIGIYVVDAKLRMRELNRAAEPVFSGIKNIVGRHIAEVLEILWGSKIAGGIVSKFENTLATGTPCHSPEFIERRQDVGVLQSYDWQLHRVALPDGGFGVVCHFVDSSVRVQLADTLRDQALSAVEADHRKDEFLALLAHELRNPLAPIRNALHVFQLSANLPATARSATEMMTRQVDQMVRLVDDLLDVSRASRGKVKLVPTIIDFTQAVGMSVDAATPMIEQQRQSITVDIADEPIHVMADITRIAQIVGNLLNNACKFTPIGGSIVVAVTTEPRQAVLRVRDNGVGIETAKLNTVFDMFMQVDTSIERRVSGLGIGLNLVRSLVELHGGTVEALSPGLGLGTEFVVRLPLVEVPAIADPGSPPVIQAMQATPLRILVVDDNLASLESMTVLLQTLGHDVHAAHDGEEAVQVAESTRPDLILLDIGMPKVNGYDACRLIRAQPWGGAMRIVALSGWASEEDREKSANAGFSAHLAKPVSFDALTRVLANDTTSQA